MKSKDWSLTISEKIGRVSCRVVAFKQPVAVVVLAHGAGAGMGHSFMESLAVALAERSIATVRFNFPYMENKKNRPDPPAIAEKTVATVIAKVSLEFGDVPLFAAGKSFGGRMTSQLLSKDHSANVKGIIFYGFPLHAIGDPTIGRAEHLKTVAVPMLFLQGTRDKLAELGLIKAVTSRLPLATLITFEGADHSFKAGKKEFITELADQTALWIGRM